MPKHVARQSSHRHSTAKAGKWSDTFSLDEIVGLWRLWRGGLTPSQAASRLAMTANSIEIAAAVRSFERAMGNYHPLEQPVRCGGCGGLLVNVPCAQCGGRRDEYRIPEERHGGT